MLHVNAAVSGAWLNRERRCQGGSESMCVHGRAALQGRVLQEGHQLNRSPRFSVLHCPADRFRFPFLFKQHCLRVLVATEPGGQWPWSSGRLQFLPLRVVHDAVTMEALFHGELLPTPRVSANIGPQLLVERANVALQVEHFGERPATAHVGTQEDHPCVSVNALVLLQEPGVTEHFAALVTFEDSPIRTKIWC